jgi:hypothetical protein
MPVNLFDDFERTEHRSGRESEPPFACLNISARPAFVAIREMLEQWFSRYPGEHRQDLRNHFRERKPHRHASAFFELFLHEYLLRPGYTVIVHPDLPETSGRPDFLIRRDGHDCFYLEATVPESVQERPGDRARVDRVHDALQQVNSPDFFLFVTHDGYPSADESVKPLVSKMEAWLGGLDYEAVQARFGEGGLDRLPRFADTIGGMGLEILPLPKSEKSRGHEGIRPVGVFGPGKAKAVDTVTAIRRALTAKAKGYSNLRLPYIVGVNVLEMFVRTDSCVDALFGREVVKIVGLLDGSERVEYVRERDGVWGNSDGDPSVGDLAVALYTDET